MKNFYHRVTQRRHGVSRSFCFYNFSPCVSVSSVFKFFFFSLFCLLLLPACTKRMVNHDANAVNEVENDEITVKIDPFRVRAQEIAASLDDRLLATQALICGVDGMGSLPSHIKGLLAEFPAGGVMLFRYNLDTENENIANFVGEAVSLIKGESGISPFVAVDHEGGTVNRFRRGVATLPAASSYWELSQKEGKEAALEKIEAESFRAGREINGMGINLNFAPVVEFLTDDNRDFLESRSYGPDPLFAAEAAAVFVRGMEQAGVLCVIKHFPGSAGNDPHYSASSLNMDKTALDSLVYPFTFLFNNGARAVMAAHTAVPAIDGEIASLSAAVMQNWLRGELGFNGIIISDDFTMAAAGNTSPEEAAIRSIAAGADMVLVWPPHLKRTHRALISALADGRLPRERLQEAVSRVIYEKLRMGLYEEK